MVTGYHARAVGRHRGRDTSAESFSVDERESVKEAYAYMDFKAGQPIVGTKIDVPSSARVPMPPVRLRGSGQGAQARQAQGAGERARLVVPGSVQVRNDMLGAAGTSLRRRWLLVPRGRLLDVPRDEPDKLKGRESAPRRPTATSRAAGFAAGRTLLMSPLMVAAAAVTGQVADARKVFGIS